MKKIFSKKTLSAFLAAIMVLAMIPMGMISAVAEAVENTDYVLGTNTITINTVEGWNYVAANQNTYADYDIKLGASLNFDDGNDDVADTTNDKPLFDEVAFAGTFDGNGNTISNFTAGSSSEKVEFGGIITTTTVGRTDLDDTKLDLSLTTDDVVVKNLTIDNATVYSSVNFGLLVGTLSADGIFENINITNVTVSGGASSGYVGGLVGLMTKDARVLANKCNVSGSITSTRDIGGIIGGVEYAQRTYYNAMTVIQDCYVNANLYADNSSGRAGGIVGGWGGRTVNSVGDANFTYSNITIDNCYCTGEYTVKNKTNRHGAVAGALRKCTAVISNTVVDVSGLTYLLCSYGHSDGTYTITNVYSTSDSTGSKLFDQGTINGTVTIITKEQATALVSKNNGYINGVAGSLVGTMKAQVTNVVDVVDGGKYIIRFVMPAYTENMSNINMTIKVKNSADTAVGEYTITCDKWDKLTDTYVDNEDAYTIISDDSASYDAKEDFNAEKLLAGAILNVPTDDNYKFEISTTFTVNGVEITSTAYGAQVTVNGDSVSVN
ncbi:MAG: hypothetical protein IJZ83_00510 [Clostridia bacterium]|nr:hypothetical protein [Clostridia bacterium]